VAGRIRLLAIVLALGASAALAAAAMAAPGDPKRVFKAADQSYARTILLRNADVPGKGWHAKATDFGQTNPACLVAHYSLSALTVNAEVGTTYTRAVDTGTFLVESDANVFLTPAQASTASAIFSKLGFARCLASSLVAEVPSGSFATSDVHRVTLAGLATASSAFRIALHVVSSKGKSTLTAVVIGLRRGRAFATLSVLTVGTGWSQSSLRSVAATMATRMTSRST
jgi:hypothetical protein